MANLYFCNDFREKLIENALSKTELVKPNNYNTIVLLSEQACNIVYIDGTMYRVPNIFKCKLEWIPDESYIIICKWFIIF